MFLVNNIYISGIGLRSVSGLFVKVPYNDVSPHGLQKIILSPGKIDFCVFWSPHNAPVNSSFCCNLYSWGFIWPVTSNHQTQQSAVRFGSVVVEHSTIHMSLPVLIMHSITPYHQGRVQLVGAWGRTKTMINNARQLSCHSLVGFRFPTVRKF